MNDDFREDLARARAAIDQFASVSRDIAAAMVVYHDELIARGLDPAAALMLTSGYQTVCVTNWMRAPGGSDDS